MAVYLLGTLDTKGEEVDLTRRLLRQLGIEVVVVDTGCLGEPTVDCDISREKVFSAAQTSLESVRSQQDRGQAVTAAAQGAAELIALAWQNKQLSGIVALGGSAGTTIGTTAMRRLPLGVPKLMISTMAAGQTRPYVSGKDILMLNSVVDIAGINRISRVIIEQAAAAMAGMVQRSFTDKAGAEADRPLIAATMFGVTTPCVQHARALLEQHGYEVLVFHATGTGGEAMEALISDGLLAGVLDLTTTELADELVGGVLSAGPDRLTAAGRRGTPQVISVGATDMVNFGPPATIPERFSDRLFHHHNPNVTLMRTTVEENARIGLEIAQRANAATGPTRVLLPLAGVSAIDAPGQPFDDPAARTALFDSLRSTLDPALCEQLPVHINDPKFAERAARLLLELIESDAQQPAEEKKAPS